MSAIGVDEHLWRRPLHELRDRTVTWLWEGRIPLGSMTLLDGDPGLGKSLVTLDLIARVTTGREMPDGTDGRDGGAILLSAEDDTEVTIRPRLLAAHADLQRVSAIETVRGVRLESGVEYERSVVLPGDISMLESSIEEIGAKLIVIDPLMAYLDPKVNSWRDQDVRATLAPLARLARHMNVAVLILRHLTKGGGLNALYRGGGSIGIIGAARSGLMIAKDPEHPEHERVLAQTKSNLGPPVTALRYRLAADDLQRAYVQWLGACDHTATSLLLSAAGETVAEPSKLEQAIALLRDECAEGPRSVEELIQRARARNISTITLRRAGDALGVDKGKAGFQGHSLWALPLPPPSLDPAELVAGDGAG